MKESEQLKSLSLKIQEPTQKSVAITKKKRKQYVRKCIYTNQGNLSTEVAPVTDFTCESVIQCDIPVAEKTFAVDFK